jgi:hypothetical protein
MRLDSLENQVEKLQEVIKRYERQYPLKAEPLKPSYAELRDWYFANRFTRSIRPAPEDYTDFDKWAKRESLQELAEHIGYPSK